MGLLEYKNKAGQRLHENFPAAVSLSCVAVAFYGVMLLGGQIVGIFSVSWLPFAPDLIKTLLFLLFYLPLRLGTKKWYYTLSETYSSPRAVFRSLLGTRYLKALFFCFVREVLMLLFLFLPFVPAAFCIGCIRFATAGGRGGVLIGALLLFTLFFLIFGAVCSVYLTLGLFYMDYLYAAGMEKTFRALLLSFSLARRERGRILSLLFGLLPRFLCCLPVVTIPVVLPVIDSRMAAFAKERIGQEVINEIFWGKERHVIAQRRKTRRYQGRNFNFDP